MPPAVEGRPAESLPRGAIDALHPSFGEALLVWARVALLSFGGPAGQIAVMHRILVEEKRWVSESRFLHALNYCMMLPGPEAQQLATYVGWLLHRTAGGLAAGLLFILPGFASILALSILYAGYRDVALVEGLFYGLKPAVVAVVVEAVVRIGKRALTTKTHVAIAAAAFAAIFFFEVPFPLIVIAAGAIGWIAGRRPSNGTRNGADQPPTIDPGSADQPVLRDGAATVRPSMRRTLRVLVVWLLVWWGPIAALLAATGPRSVYSKEALFFSHTAVVTFGGAYAVLAYVAEECVDQYGWLEPREMLDGLGMAETTPGPLIQVVQFVGFMGAYRNAGELSPLAAGVLGSIVTTWATFTPCFLWIFLGAPYIEYLRGQKALNAALSGITAAVVGVILNLSIWFAVHTVFSRVVERRAYGVRLLVPDWDTLDPAALLIALAAMIALFRFKIGMLRTLAGSAAAGLAWHVAG